MRNQISMCRSIKAKISQHQATSAGLIQSGAYSKYSSCQCHSHTKFPQSLHYRVLDETLIVTNLDYG